MIPINSYSSAATGLPIFGIECFGMINFINFIKKFTSYHELNGMLIPSIPKKINQIQRKPFRNNFVKE